MRDWMGLRGGRKARTRASQASGGGLGLRQERSERKAPLGLFAERLREGREFFEDHFVANYCPLVFMEEGGKNRTPDKLPASETKALEEACDAHLARVADALDPSGWSGWGLCAEKSRNGSGWERPEDRKDLHPSPASPAANRGWAEAATKQLDEQGIW